jgi:glycosyltransferase involved in cell wall biosynthesis
MATIALFISSMQGGGAERVIAKLADYWSSRGDEVHIISIAGIDLDVYKTKTDVQRHSLNAFSMSSDLPRAILANITRVYRLRTLLTVVKPDVVLSFLPECNVIALIATRGLGVRVIVAERNFAGVEYLPIHWRFLRRSLYRFSDLVVTQTSLGKIWLRENTSSRDIAIIPNVAYWPLERGNPILSPADYVGSERFILGVGRLTDQKGFDLLIQAFSNVAKTNPDVQLVIAGTGDCEQSLRDLISEKDLAARIHLVGRVGNLTDWYEACELFVLSSRFEGFPNALLEAMSAGCAVVSCDCPTGPSDIIQHDKNGLLVAPESTALLSEAIDTVLNDAELRVRLENYALEIREKYNQWGIMREWDNALDLEK